MRLRTSARLLALLLSAVPMAHAASEGEEEADCIASVTPGNAAFWLHNPYGVDDWRWNRDETHDRHMEFQWSVSVSAGNEEEPCPERDFGLGITRFKWDAHPERAGTLADLLQQSQYTVWTRTFQDTGTYYRPIEGADIRGGVHNDGILMGLLDAETIAKIFGHRPSTAYFYALIPGGLSYACTAEIEYWEEGDEESPN